MGKRLQREDSEADENSTQLKDEDEVARTRPPPAARSREHTTWFSPSNRCVFSVRSLAVTSRLRSRPTHATPLLLSTSHSHPFTALPHSTHSLLCIFGPIFLLSLLCQVHILHFCTKVEERTPIKLQLCKISRRIGCVIPRCKLQRGITQPIL